MFIDILSAFELLFWLHLDFSQLTGVSSHLLGPFEMFWRMECSGVASFANCVCKHPSLLQITLKSGLDDLQCDISNLSNRD